MINAPMPTSAAQAGSNSEMKASNSPNASTNTTSGAQAWCALTNSMIWSAVGFDRFEHLAGGFLAGARALACPPSNTSPAT